MPARTTDCRRAVAPVALLRRFGAIAALVGLSATAGHAGAVPLNQLVASGGSLVFGNLMFSQFAIQPVPLSSPQGAQVNNGEDIDVSAGSFAGGPGLRLMHIDPTTLAPSPLSVDLSTHGPKNTLRNISYVVTVLDPLLLIHAATQTLGPASAATLSVTGFIGTYWFPAGIPGGASLLDEYNLVDPALGGSFGFNSPDLPTGNVATLGFDTAWALTSAHGNPSSGTARVDWIDVGYALVPVPEPASAWLGAAGMAGLLWQRRRRGRAGRRTGAV